MQSRQDAERDHVSAGTGHAAKRPDIAAAPAISLPKGGGAIRGIDEKLSVDPAAGTLSLSVPIAVSPGRQGFQPRLALSYDSAAGHGPFGAGWRLGLPAVTRRTDRGLPRYRDAEESDSFLLTGGEELVPALVRDGDDWIADTHSRIEEGTAYQVVRYRPRIEGAFIRIERWTRLVGGGTHWRSVSRDNVIRLFGRSAAGRIADPEQPQRVFSWLLEEERDDKGNVTVYRYKQEDGAGLGPTESSRSADATANRYPKRILYGNARPFEPADWRFEVVFDYGDHDPNRPTPHESAVWPCRPDPFSRYRSGFEIRARRLCRRVLMFHRFPELGPDPCLVHSTDLAYARDPILTRLTGITRRGYFRAGGGYESSALPALEFDYSLPQPTAQAHVPEVHQLGDLPAGLADGRHRWTDLDGEGLPGFLTEQAGAWYYRSNLGSGRFGPARRLAARPSTALLGGGSQQLTDLSGDGRQDLVQLDEPLSGFFARTGSDGWEGFRPFASLPNLDWRDPDLRWIDLTGDGRADLLISREEAFLWHPSLGERGFGPSRVERRLHDEAAGPTGLFSDPDQSIYLADMSGDGLPDLVRIRNGSIDYWPNLGYGRFGTRVAMRDAPRFDAPDRFDRARLRLADINGSGTTDLLYADGGGVRYWLNHSGNGWSPARRISGLPPVDDTTSLSVLDLLGNGTACLVWSSPLPGHRERPLRWLELTGGTKPYLLTALRNNLGLERRFEYAPSTRFYTADRAAGRPWLTRIPFPVQLLARMETRDLVAETLLVNRYAYHHGHYDGRERELRGFALVEQWDTESQPGTGPGETLELPPVHTRSWFHTGAFLGRRNFETRLAEEFYRGDGQAAPPPFARLPPDLDAAAEREACRALKGRPLRVEVYAADGSARSVHPYQVSCHGHRLRPVQPAAGERPAVFFPYSAETLELHYERNPDDPRTTQQLTLVLDAFGNVSRSAAVAYPRRGDTAHPEQRRLLITLSEADFLNQTGTPDRYRVGLPCRSATYQLTGLEPPAARPFTTGEVLAAWDRAAEIPFEATSSPGVTEKRVVGRSRTSYYDAELKAELPFGQAGPRGLVFRQYELAFTPGLLRQVYGDRLDRQVLANEGGYLQPEDLWWVPSGRQVFDPLHFCLPVTSIDPFGAETCVEYDPHALLITATRDPLGNRTGARHDYRVLQPREVTDPNGNRSLFAFDPLGMVCATALAGKAGQTDPAAMGDTLEAPTSHFEYDLDAWHRDGRPVHAHTYAREHHGRADTRWQESRVYSDGSGREIMTKTRAAPGPVPRPDGAGGLTWEEAPERWTGTGRTLYDNKGNPVKQYEPFFSRSPGFETETELVRWGVTPILHYDPLGRLVRTDRPDGTLSRVEFDPWCSTAWDGNDTCTESGWYAARADLPEQDPDGRSARQAAAHAGTPTRTHLDCLGRAFLVVEDNGGGAAHNTRTGLDIAGNPLAVTDPRGNTLITRRWDPLGRELYRDTMDGGERRLLPDCQGNPLRTWDARGHRLRNGYDALRRPTHLFLHRDKGAEILLRRTLYGENHPRAAALNLCTRPCLRLDESGLTGFDAYDFKGNLLSARRRLVRDWRQTADWRPTAGLDDQEAMLKAAAPLLEEEDFTSRTTYDALNRVVQAEQPDGSRIRPAYDAGSRLESLEAALRGDGRWTPFVERIDYDARGRRSRIRYGNGTRTDYGYDPRSFRLTRLRTTRDKDRSLLQDLHYHYDPVGNITGITDRARQTLFFANATVSPDARYTYDPLYRLVAAEGREHAGQLADPAHRDCPGRPLPHPNDANALRRYHEEFAYDPAGNLERLLHRFEGGGWTRSFDIDPRSNRLLAVSLPGDAAAGRLAYDAHGNTTRMPHLEEMTWDHADRLRRIDLGGGGTAWYLYDGEGNRIRKVIESGAGLRRERIYLGDFELYREHDGKGLRFERQTLHIMDDRRRIALVETRTVEERRPLPGPQPVLRYQLDNHLGSATLELDRDGALLSYEEYRPYGSTSYRAARGAAEVSLKRYRYTGKERDEESGLYYYGARYYWPGWGRFISVDPALEGVNWYGYAAGNPVKYRDPTGTRASMTESPDEKEPDTGAPPRRIDDYAEFIAAAFERNEIEEILSALRSGPNIHFGEVSDMYVQGEREDKGFHRIFLDPHPSSRKQTGHFLTAVSLGYQVETGVALVFRPFRAEGLAVTALGTLFGLKGILLGFGINYLLLGDDSQTVAKHLIVGHELAADVWLQDTVAESAGGYSRAVWQYLISDRQVIGIFTEAADMVQADPDSLETLEQAFGLLRNIPLDESRTGNSYSDLRLSLLGYVFGRLVRQGHFEDRAATADWLRNRLKENPDIYKSIESSPVKPAATPPAPLPLMKQYDPCRFCIP